MNHNNIYTTDEIFQKRVSDWPCLKSVYAGCRIAVGIDSSGALHDFPMAVLKPGYWDNIIQLAPDKYHSHVLFGLKADGTCVVSKAPFAGWSSYSRQYESTVMGNDAFEALLHAIHSWEGIVQIAASGALLLALDSNGKVHARQYLWDRWDPFFSSETDALPQTIKEAVSTWHDVRRILVAEENIVIAQKNSGEMLFAGNPTDLYGVFGRSNYLKLQDAELIDACTYFGGESMYFAFLDSEKNVHSGLCRYPEAEMSHFIQLEGLDHSFLGLRDDGRIISFRGFETDRLLWPGIKQIALGRRDFQRYDDLFLVGLSAEPCVQQTVETNPPELLSK